MNIHIKQGDIIFRQNSSWSVAVGQYVLSLGDSPNISSTHVAVVIAVGKKSIHLLETVYRKNYNGVNLIKYNFDEFKEYIGKGLHILSNSKLQKQIVKYSTLFASNYASAKVKTSYSFLHLAYTLSSSLDTDTGRKRTIFSYRNKRLMNSLNQERSGAICSELVAEIIKLSQISALKISSEQITVKKLKELQDKNFVLNVSAQNISVSKLENELIQQHQFTCQNLKRNDFENSSSDESLELG